MYFFFTRASTLKHTMDWSSVHAINLTLIIHSAEVTSCDHCRAKLQWNILAFWAYTAAIVAYTAWNYFQTTSSHKILTASALRKGLTQFPSPRYRFAFELLTTFRKSSWSSAFSALIFVSIPAVTGCAKVLEQLCEGRLSSSSFTFSFSTSALTFSLPLICSSVRFASL